MGDYVEVSKYIKVDLNDVLKIMIFGFWGVLNVFLWNRCCLWYFVSIVLFVLNIIFVLNWYLLFFG